MKTIRATLPILTALALAAAVAPVCAHGEALRRGAPERDRVETSFGQTGDPRKVTRTIPIIMADTMRFTPAVLTVKQGETIRFVVRNRGQVLHEMVLGTDEELAQHAALMKQHPGMEHEEPYMAHVGPGQRGEIVWQFSQPGRFKFACLVPGHFEAGMIGTIEVISK